VRAFREYSLDARPLFSVTAFLSQRPRAVCWEPSVAPLGLSFEPKLSSTYGLRVIRKALFRFSVTAEAFTVFASVIVRYFKKNCSMIRLVL
jgi:hypothetical protein